MNNYETLIVIDDICKWFEDELRKNLQLYKVPAPLFVKKESGLNDELSGNEDAVSFTPTNLNKECVIVHSLAKWKRMKLYENKFKMYDGIITNMIAIRQNEQLDETHSILVDQWDWEKIIDIKDRTLDFLKDIVLKIIKTLFTVINLLKANYPLLDHLSNFDSNVSFITTDDLLDLYPNEDPQTRENLYVKKYKTTCLMKVGSQLKNNTIHEKRAPDYDDWNLNCDILFWHHGLNKALELSSMGIRVDAKSLFHQLTISNNLNKLDYDYHSLIVKSDLPFTIGGGIGRSRLLMLLLNKKHIKEVQESVWN